MHKKTLLFILFILVALTQLYVPAKMVFDKEEVISTGKVFKFLTAPIDPSDPFRGKYITLTFKENSFPLQNKNEWERNEPIFVLLTSDSAGYAKIASVSKTKPAHDADHVRAKVRYVTKDEIHIEWPFSRFYMEESKAPLAEKAYRESARDTSRTTYALLLVKDGEAVLTDVLINEISIAELVRSDNNAD